MSHPIGHFNVPGLLALVASCLAASSPTGGQEPYFPESVFLPRNEAVNSIIDDGTSVHLRAMNEPSLWKLSRDEPTANVYRFLWRASGQHPVCVRLTQTGGAYALQVAGHDGPPGITAGRLTLSKDVKLSVGQGERLVGLLGRTKFWAAPVYVRENLGIADGDVIAIEGVKGGRYQVVVRAGLTTGESYKTFCRALLEAASEPDVLKVWDGFREADRKYPGYQPEPPQTAYLGDFIPADDAPEGSRPARTNTSPAWRYHRVRFTVRRLMPAAAVAGVLDGAAVAVAGLLDGAYAQCTGLLARRAAEADLASQYGGKEEIQRSLAEAHEKSAETNDPTPRIVGPNGGRPRTRTSSESARTPPMRPIGGRRTGPTSPDRSVSVPKPLRP